MTVGWIIFEIAINLYQSLLYLFFLKNCVPLAKSSKAMDILCVLACAGFYTLYLFFDIAVTDSLNVLILFLYLLYMSEERWYVLALWVMVKEVIVIATVGFMLQLCQAVTSATHAMLMEIGPLRLVFVISTNLVLFLVLFIFLRKMKKTDSPLSLQALLYFLVTNTAVLFAIEMIFSLQETYLDTPDWHVFAAYGALLVCSVLSVFLYHIMTGIVQKENQAQAALNHARLTRKHQMVLKDMYTDMIARQHDFRHQLQTIEQLVNQGNSEEAKAYLAEYEKEISEDKMIITGSIAVDALLTAKLLACKQNDIEFRFVQCPLGNLPISEIDFCAIVGNLLDNAIEGVCRIADMQNQKWICLSFNRVWDTFSIHCENNMAIQTVKRHSRGFFTAKESDIVNHGFGIRNIELIVETANGFCTFEAADNVFTANVTLPYPIQEAIACSKS